MHPIALLFSGQGSQRVGMADGFDHPAATDLLAHAGTALGWPLAQVMAGGPIDELTRTSRCQPALYVHGLMLLAVLRATCPGIRISAAAGLSLGEFTAHAAAGTFSFADGLQLVARRGAFMEDACHASRGAMVAMIGGDESAIRQLAADCAVDVANLNAPGQIVLSGPEDGIDRAAARAKEIGVKMAKKLVVAGAYHSRLMAPARDRLAATLEEIPISPPDFPVWSNVAAAPFSEPAAIRTSLTDQVTGSVRWAESITAMVAAGHTRFLELGPDKALAAMMKRTAPDATIASASNPAELGAALEALTA